MIKITFGRLKESNLEYSIQLVFVSKNNACSSKSWQLAHKYKRNNRLNSKKIDTVQLDLLLLHFIDFLCCHGSSVPFYESRMTQFWRAFATWAL